MTRTRSQPEIEEERPLRSEPPLSVPPWVWLIIGFVFVLILVGLLVAVVDDEPEVQVDPLGLEDQPADDPDSEIVVVEPDGGAPVTAEDPDADEPGAAVPADVGNLEDVDPAEAGKVLVDDVSLLPIPEEGLRPYTDRPADAVAVPVYSVVADEGFWIGDSDTNRIYVVLVTAGAESPPDIDAGQIVSFAAELQPIEDLGAFEQEFALTMGEGRGLLREQGAYLATAKVTILQ